MPRCTAEWERPLSSLVKAAKEGVVSKMVFSKAVSLMASSFPPKVQGRRMAGSIKSGMG